MPIQQICTVVSMEQLDHCTWWMVLEAGKLVLEHGLRGGQFLHIKCGDGQLLRRPISVARTQWDEPEDTAALIFEVRGEGTRWLSQRKIGDKLDVLGPLGNGFDVSEKGRYLLVGGGIGVPPLMEYGESPCGQKWLCWAFGPRIRHSLPSHAAFRRTANKPTSAPMTAPWAVTVLWTVR